MCTKNHIVALIVMLALQGCATPDETATQAFAPVIDREIVSVSTNPLAITDAVRLAILSSTDVAEAEFGIQTSNNDVRIAKANFYPELYANVSPNSSGIVNANAGLRYTLYDFGERSAILSGSIVGVEGSRHELLTQIEGTARTVTEQYIYLSIENEQVAAALDYQKSVANLESGVRARADIGIASSVDINEIDTAMIQAETAVLEARADRNNAQESLSSTLGLTPNGVNDPNKISQLLSVDTVSINALDFDTFPRIAALQASVEQAEYDEAAVKAGLLPRIGLQLGLNVGLDASDGISGQGVTIGPEISEVVSLGGGRQERIQNAEIAVQIAERKRGEEVRLARLEAVQAQTVLSASAQRLAQRNDVVRLTINTRDLMLGEYDVGTRSLRDLLDAEERIYRAQKDANDALRINLEARLRYIAAINRLSDYLYEISL